MQTAAMPSTSTVQMKEADLTCWMWITVRKPKTKFSESDPNFRMRVLNQLAESSRSQ